MAAVPAKALRVTRAPEVGLRDRIGTTIPPGPRRSRSPAFGGPARSFSTALHSHPRGILTQPDACANLGEGAVFEMAQQHTHPVLFVERVHGVIRKAKPSPVWFRFDGLEEVCSWCGLAFTVVAPMLSAADVGREKAGARVKPTGQRRVSCQAASLSGEVGEDRLGHVLGQVSIAVDLAQRRRIHKIHVPAH
jgi:hypothetical protein